MSTNNPSAPHPASDWSVGVRVWVAHASKTVIGAEQLAVLEAIDRCGSLSSAARNLGIQYRRVWESVQAMNEAAGAPLVISAVGGQHGGGASLTPLGRWAITAFRETQRQLQQAAAGLTLRLCVPPAHPVLHVFAAVSLSEVLAQAFADFAAIAPEVRVRTVVGASDELVDHILAGIPGDLFLTADPGQLDRLQSARLLLPGAVVLAENSLAVMAPPGSPIVIRQVPDLAAPHLRVAVASADCPLGRYTREYLDAFHVWESVLRRAVQLENSRSVLTAIRAGQADLGLVYASDAVSAESCRMLLRVQTTPSPIRYTGCVLSSSADPVNARRLLTFLTTAEARDRFRRCGFLPPHS